MSTHKEVQKRMRMLRSRKALSPVVASIILIAVTVAVSIAVAAWMGALTFTFMATEQIQITNIGFNVGPFPGTGWITVTVNNTGTSPVTINEAWVNNVKKPTTAPSLPRNILANQGVLLYVNTTVVNGNNYQVKLVSSKGNQFAYSAYAPGA
jgi:flagellin-like protein